MSSTLWATVASQQNPDVSSLVAGIQVELREKPTGLVVTSQVSPVTVDVRAPADVLSRLLPGTFRAHTDISDAVAGVAEFPVRVETTDRRVRIERVTPANVTIKLETIKKKEVPVRLEVVENPPFGYIARAAKASPAYVTVSGPEGQVDRVNAAAVEVRLGNARSSISQPLRAQAQSATGEPIKDVATAPENVLVEVPVEQQLTYKTLPIAPQIAGTVALGYQIIGIMVDPTVITAVGEPGVLDATSYVGTQPIDMSGATADVVANGEVLLPSGVSLVRRQPITVRVYLSPVEANKTVRLTPQVKGLADHLRAEATPNAVDVTVSGPMPLLNTLRPQDVQIGVDVTGQITGTNMLTVTASVASPLRVDNISPRQLSVAVRSR